METQSEHPIAKGIVKKAKELGVTIPSSKGFKAIKGKGVQGQVEGRDILVVSPGFLKEQGLKKPQGSKAQVGIAIGSGTDVAAATADIILVNSNPLDVTSLILFGKATYKKMMQNLIWATGYNVVAIPLAAGIFSNAGIVLSLEIGALLMSLSTVIVAINARLLHVTKKQATEHVV